MKKIIALLLAALTVLAAFASCTANESETAVTSSGNYADEAWLVSRLGKLPEGLVVTTDGAAYGVDTSTLESDGYVIKTTGGTTVIAANGTGGIDLAVRRYAKEFEAGTADGLNVTYHEGYRIKHFLIDGRDISEFTVVYSDPTEPSFPGTGKEGYYSVGNAKYAATELCRLIKKACGADLPCVCSDVPVNSHAIYVSYLRDGSVGERGFSYYVENGDLYVFGAPDSAGCSNGVYHFLEYQCGWDGLMYGDSVLAEADTVNVPADLNVKIKPIFDYFRPYGDGELVIPYANERGADAQSCTNGIVDHACHGLISGQFLTFGNQYAEGSPCYTSEEFIEVVSEEAIEYAEARNALGYKYTVCDVSHGDNMAYCTCQNCMKIARKYGGENSAMVIYFANAVDDALHAAGIDNVYLNVFAYHKSNGPCTLKPHDNVFITYCLDGSCSSHPLNGSECDGASNTLNFNGVDPINNNQYREWLEGWCEMSDHVIVWDYQMQQLFHNYSWIDFMYDDFMLMKDCGVYGIFLQQEGAGFGFSRINLELAYSLCFNPDWTEEEFYAQFEKICRKEFGEGYEYLMNYREDVLVPAQELVSCRDCWKYTYLSWTEELNINEFASRVDMGIDYIEKTLHGADSARHEALCEVFLSEVLYQKCYVNYFKLADAGDTEGLAELSDIYDRAIGLMIKHGYLKNNARKPDNPHVFNAYYLLVDVYDNITDAANNTWIECRDLLP